MQIKIKHFCQKALYTLSFFISWASFIIPLNLNSATSKMWLQGLLRVSLLVQNLLGRDCRSVLTFASAPYHWHVNPLIWRIKTKLNWGQMTWTQGCRRLVGSVLHALHYPQSPPPSWLLCTPGHLHRCLWCPPCLTAPWCGPDHPFPMQASRYWLHHQPTPLSKGIQEKAKIQGTVRTLLIPKGTARKINLFWNTCGVTRSSWWTH